MRRACSATSLTGGGDECLPLLLTAIATGLVDIVDAATREARTLYSAASSASSLLRTTSVTDGGGGGA